MSNSKYPPIGFQVPLSPDDFARLDQIWNDGGFIRDGRCYRYDEIRAKLGLSSVAMQAIPPGMKVIQIGIDDDAVEHFKRLFPKT